MLYLEHPKANKDAKWFVCLVVGTKTIIDYPLIASCLDKVLSKKVKDGYKIMIVTDDPIIRMYASLHNYKVRVHKANNYCGMNAVHKYVASYTYRGCVAFGNGNETNASIALAKEYHTPIRVVCRD